MRGDKGQTQVKRTGFKVVGQPLQDQVPVAIVVTVDGNHFNDVRVTEVLEHPDLALKSLTRSLIGRSKPHPLNGYQPTGLCVICLRDNSLSTLAACVAQGIAIAEQLWPTVRFSRHPMINSRALISAARLVRREWLRPRLLPSRERASALSPGKDTAPPPGVERETRSCGAGVRCWHEPSVPFAARTGPVVGVELPVVGQIVCALRFFYGVTLGHATVPETYRIPC